MELHRAEVIGSLRHRESLLSLEFIRTETPGTYGGYLKNPTTTPDARPDGHSKYLRVNRLKRNVSRGCALPVFRSS